MFSWKNKKNINTLLLKKKSPYLELWVILHSFTLNSLCLPITYTESNNSVKGQQSSWLDSTDLGTLCLHYLRRHHFAWCSLYKFMAQPTALVFSVLANSIWLRGYRTFSCSTQLSMKFSLLINMKMPTIVGIFIFISREIFMLSYV